jgi:hypothetical protein
LAKKLFRVFAGVLVATLVLVAVLIVAVRQTAFQTYLAQRFSSILSHSLNTKVSIEKVQLSFFHDADLVNFYMEDHEHQAMISAKELKIQFKVFELFRKKITISSISLEGGFFYLHADSTGKKTNIGDVFKTLQSKKEEPKNPSAPAAFTWDISLEELNASHIAFRFNNEHTHLNLQAQLPSAQIVMDELDIAQKLISVRSITTDSLSLALDLMKGPKYEEDTTKKEPSAPDGFKITFGKLNVAHASFQFTDHNSDSILPKRVDFKHLDVSDINLTAENGLRNADTFYASIKTFSANERSGFAVKSISALAQISPNDITLVNLDVQTAESNINNYLSFHFNSLIDFKDFMTAVRIKARMNDTKFALKDLSYFIQGLDKFESTKFIINGEIDGRVNNLKGRGIEVRTLKNTVFKGDFYTRGLPNLNEASLNLRVERLSTSAEDVKKIYPGVNLPENLNTLGVIDYAGSLDGFVSDFVSKGKLTTAIGSTTVDVHFKYNKEKDKASYDGELALDEFDLGKYISNEQLLGKISLNAKLDGEGITLAKLKAKIEGNISSFTAMGYEYRDIKINGALLKKSFNGTMAVRDKYLDLDFNGKADLTQKIPQFNFDATVRKSMLKGLNLTKENIALSGAMKTDFRGDKIDNFIGSINLNNVAISRDSISASVKNFSLDAKLLSSQSKQITLSSDFAEGEMSGDFNIKTLPRSLLSFLKTTFTKNNTDTSTAPAENFALDVRIFDPGNLPRILLPKLTNVNASRITCNYNSVDNKLALTANIAEVDYAGFDIKGAAITTNTSKGAFDFTSSVGRIYNGDSVLLDSISLVSKTQGNDIRFDLVTADEYGINYAKLTAFVTPVRHTTLIRIDSTDIRLSNNNWHFDPNDTITIDGTKITSKNLVFRNEKQAVFIDSYLKNDTSTSVKVTLENTGIRDFASTFTSKTKDMDGQINGKIVVEDIFYKPEIYGDVVVNHFMLGKQLIGDINIDSKLDSSGKNIMVFASVKSPNNNLEARGYVSIDPDNPGMKIDVDAPKVDLNFLNYKFFDKYVKNVKGFAAIKASAYGTLKKPLLGGSVLLQDDTVTVSFTNVTYTLHNQKAILDEHGFDLNGITISDMKGHYAYNSGRINHESFKDFGLDLQVSTRNPATPDTKNIVQFLNTTDKESPGFYGVAYGDGRIEFAGPINSPDITANASTGPNTYCRLPILSSYETGRYSFYKFLSNNRDTTSSSKLKPHVNGVNFKIVLDVNTDARMDIILDPVAGDMLTGYGRGNLTIALPKTGSAVMYGQYEIDRGNYTFTFKNLITKRFDINKGGTIDFSGEVYKARLNLDAVYEVRTSVSDLIDDMINNGGSGSSSASSSNLAAAALTRVPVDLLMNLTGVLEKPNIAFNIKVIDPDPTVKSYVDQKIALLKTNETEMNKQVVGLLIMNKFIPSSSSTTGAIANNISGTAANTVSEFVSSQLSNYLSNLLEFANIHNLDVNVGFRQYDPASVLASGAVSPNAASSSSSKEVQLALSQRLLNNRLSINAGGNLDFGGSNVDPYNPAAVSNKSVIPTGDFQIEYSLTPDGVWRAKIFNRTNYDYYNARNTNRTGVGISYRREFNKFSELFQKNPNPNKKKKNIPAAPSPPAAVAPTGRNGN